MIVVATSVHVCDTSLNLFYRFLNTLNLLSISLKQILYLGIQIFKYIVEVLERSTQHFNDHRAIPGKQSRAAGFSPFWISLTQNFLYSSKRSSFAAEYGISSLTLPWHSPSSSTSSTTCSSPSSSARGCSAGVCSCLSVLLQPSSSPSPSSS